MLSKQYEIEHSQAKVGACPFCRGKNSAELWFDPANEIRPFQVRCGDCGARGPYGDCGWECAVPSWDVVRRTDIRVEWRGPNSGKSDPHSKDGHGAKASAAIP